MDQLPFRVQNIFNQLFSPQTQDNTQPQLANMPEPQLQGGFSGSSVPQDDIVKSLFQNQTGANDRLIEMMSNQPQHDQYKPNFGQKLVGGLISINDPRQGQAYLNRGYDNAMQDWSGKLKPLGELADSERAQNTNNRLTANSMLRDQNADLENKRKVAKDEADAKAKQATVDQKDRFLAYKQNKDAHPNHIYKSDKDGHVYSVDPQTNGVEYLTTPNGDLIEDSKLPEIERLQIQQNNSMGQIAARGNESRKTVGTQQSKEIAVDEAKQPNRVALKTTTPGKNLNAVTPAVKPGDEQIKVIHPGDKTHPQGTPGFVKKSQLRDALTQGFVVVPDTPVQGVGLNLKPVVKPKTSF